MLRLLTALLCLATLHAAQPTLTSVSTLGGGTEDTPYVITYAAVLAASDASGDTQRIRVQSLIEGSLASRPLGSVGVGTPVVLPYLYLDNTVELVWTPAAHANGVRGAIAIYANDGLGDGGGHDSALPENVTVNLAEVYDPQTAASFVNARTLTEARPIAVTEDTWLELTFAELVARTATTEVDGDAFWYVISALGDGTLAATSGGDALAVGDSINSGESLWWLPSADRFTKQGATADLDEAPVRFVTLTVRKIHAGITRNLTGIELSSTIDGVDDPFIDHGISSGFTPVSIVRGHSITMTTAEWLAHIQDFVNTDRDASIEAFLTSPQSTDWKIAAFDPAFPDIPQLEHTGIAIGGSTYPDGWSIRLTPPTTLGVGTYVLGPCWAWDEVSSQLSHATDFTIRIVESTSGDGDAGGGGGVCGGGSSLSLLTLVLCAALGLIRQGRR